MLERLGEPLHFYPGWCRRSRWKRLCRLSIAVLCLPHRIQETFLNSRAATPVSPTIFPSSVPTQSSFPLLPLSRPQSQFYFGPSGDGVFGHTGVRPNAVIHHPRCNTYNVLCRMANPSPILMLLPKHNHHPFPRKGCIMRRCTSLKIPRGYFPSERTLNRV